MYSKEINYEDFDGNQRKEKAHFNLTKAEMTEMSLGVSGGMDKVIQRIIEENNMPKIIEYFKEIILKSYGVRSDDGRVFRKFDAVDGHRLADDFAQTQAYSELFMELATNTKSAIDFINGIMPKDMRQDNLEQKATELLNK